MVLIRSIKVIVKQINKVNMIEAVSTYTNILKGFKA